MNKKDFIVSSKSKTISTRAPDLNRQILFNKKRFGAQNINCWFFQGKCGNKEVFTVNLSRIRSTHFKIPLGHSQLFSCFQSRLVGRTLLIQYVQYRSPSIGNIFTGPGWLSVVHTSRRTPAYDGSLVGHQRPFYLLKCMT